MTHAFMSSNTRRALRLLAAWLLLISGTTPSAAQSDTTRTYPFSVSLAPPSFGNATEGIQRIVSARAGFEYTIGQVGLVTEAGGYSFRAEADTWRIQLTPQLRTYLDPQQRVYLGAGVSAIVGRGTPYASHPANGKTYGAGLFFYEVGVKWPILNRSHRVNFGLGLYARNNMCLFGNAQAQTGILILRGAEVGANLLLFF